MSSQDPQVRTVRIEGDGPHGPLSVLEIQIDIAEWREARDAPDGSLHHVRGAIKDLTTAVKSVDSTMRSVSDRSKREDEAIVEFNGMSDVFIREQHGTAVSHRTAESGTDLAELRSASTTE